MRRVSPLDMYFVIDVSKKIQLSKERQKKKKVYIYIYIS